MTRFLRLVCPILSIALLAAGYFFSGLGWFALGLLVFGIFWIIGLTLRLDYFQLLGLFVAFGMAAVGFFINVLPAFLIPAALLALLAWDLAEFHIRLCLASPDDEIGLLEKRHLSRLFAIALVAGGLSAFGLKVHFKPSFEWLVILMFFTVWGIGRMVNWLLKQGS